MKYFAIAATVLIVLVAGIAFKSRQGNPTVAVTPSSEYRLIVLADMVSLTRVGTTTPEKVTGTTTVAQGDRITTSATGRARLRWPNDTVTTLEADTQITIQNLSDGGFVSRIDLIFGDVWSKVSRVLGTGQYYEIQTQETVAAVRGTVFRFSYRNHKARVQGIERTVRVSLRSKDGTTDESTTVDVEEETVAEIDTTVTTPKEKRITRHTLTSQEKEEKIHLRIKREKDRVDKDEDIDREGDTPQPTTTILPSATPKPSISVRPSVSPTPTTTVTSQPTPQATVTATATPTLIVATPTPLSAVSIDHTFPKTIAPGDTFSLEGANYIEGRNTSRVASITVGGQSASYSIVGSTSIFVTPNQLPTGIYDVTLVTTDGQTLTLKAAITIQ